jgi:lipoprotein-anchoring transpeptidase ErfK/SrfK
MVGRRIRTTLMSLTALGLVVVVAACTSSPAPTFVVPPPPPAQLSFSHAADAADVSPGEPVTVDVVDGMLQDVTLVSNLGEVPGAFSADYTSWRSEEDLHYDKTYTLTVKSVGLDSVIVEETRKFTTVAVSPGFYWSVAFSSGGGKHYSTPLDGRTFGVGQPIIARFDDVVDRKVAEGTLKVTTTPRVEGSWSWISDREVHWRPKTYWPAGARVTVEAKILGVKLTSPSGGRVLHGKENNSASFTIGRSRIAKIDNKTKKMLVYVDGQLVKTIPVSLGRQQSYRDSEGVWHDYRTTSGIHVVTEKQDPVRMRPNLPEDDPGYYDQLVNLAVRITDSGIYVHSAPWSVWAQGSQNVSHGCINVSPANAQWFYDDAIPGDVVEIVNTGSKLQPWDGITDWNKTWDTWAKGSALYTAPPATPPTSPSPSPSTAG